MPLFELTEMIEEAPKSKGAAEAGTKREGERGKLRTVDGTARSPSLISQGIDENLAKRARTLARMPKAEFNTKLRDLRATVRDVLNWFDINIVS